MVACFERASWVAQVFLQELEKVSWGSWHQAVAALCSPSICRPTLSP